MNHADNTNATGLDLSIRKIALELAQLPWLETIYGRAYSFKTEQGKVKPYAYTTAGEYINVLPDDSFQSQCFFKAKGDELLNFDVSKGSRRTGLIRFERELSLIVWANLGVLDYPPQPDYNYTERLKEEVLKRLKASAEVVQIRAYIDEDSRKVFDGYDLDDVQTHFLMMPFSGFRVDFVVRYQEVC